MTNNCKLTARLDNGDTFAEEVSVIWINPKGVTVKVPSGAYHRFPIERVISLEWIKTARIAYRMCNGEASWGFDAPEGFACFGLDERSKDLAGKCAERYNQGDTDGWYFSPIANCPLAVSTD